MLLNWEEGIYSMHALYKRFMDEGMHIIAGRPDWRKLSEVALYSTTRAVSSKYYHHYKPAAEIGCNPKVD